MLPDAFPLLLQAQGTTGLDSLATAPLASESLLDVLLESGTLTMIIVGILLVLFVIAVYIFSERYITIKAAGSDDEGLHGAHPP